MSRDGISSAISNMILGLYGPKFCPKCNRIQPVNTFVLAKSEWFEGGYPESTTASAGFTGGYQCRVCLRPIDIQPKKGSPTPERTDQS